MQSLSVYRVKLQGSSRKKQTDVSNEESICDNNMLPGSGVSVDHFESQMKGQTYTYFGSSNYEKNIE